MRAAVTSSMPQPVSLTETQTPASLSTRLNSMVMVPIAVPIACAALVTKLTMT